MTWFLTLWTMLLHDQSRLADADPAYDRGSLPPSRSHTLELSELTENQYSIMRYFE